MLMSMLDAESGHSITHISKPPRIMKTHAENDRPYDEASDPRRAVDGSRSANLAREGIDDEQIAYDATLRLVGKGCRRIALQLLA